MDNLTKTFTITLTKQELILIHNVLAVNEDGTPKKYRLGDGQIVLGILQKVAPLAAQDTNIPEEEQGKQPAPEELIEEPFEVETTPAVIGTDADGAKEDTTN